ncbi:hypothetical protein AB4Z14_17965 [Terrabacter sp. 2TAF16]|uniref:hypothetical protein n=1 Tax=Terrabacter sp. 2TAF16 TaxID=3233008 RepID=UPI003F9E0CED
MVHGTIPCAGPTVDPGARPDDAHDAASPPPRCHGVAPRSGHGVVAASSVVTTTPSSGLRIEGGPNADGWYAAPARYHWVAQDLGGGIASCQSGSVVAVDSGVLRTVYGTPPTCFVRDRAGNLASASVSYLVADRRLRQG